MTNVRELVCLPDAFYGRDYINVTNPLASGQMTSATYLRREVVAVDLDCFSGDP